MNTAFARNGEVEIAYETFGDPGGQPLLLLNGLDYQMVWWPEALCTALAYVVYFRILSGAGATNVLLVTLVAPATLVVLGALFLHERVLARQFLGFGIIALGLAFIDGRLPRALFGGRNNPNPASGNSRLPIGEKSR